MIPDRNKSELTHKVTEAAWQWLDTHGFKPVETEVQVAPKWCADLAGVIVPTQTELIEMKLLKRRPKYNSPEYPDWYAARTLLCRRMTCIVEVKTSRSDFIGDKKWQKEPPADLAYLAIPAGMIKESERPFGWGVLEFSEESMRQTQVPTVGDTGENHVSIIYQIAVRRDHRTRYAEHREQQKAWRVQDGEIQTNHRIGKILNAIDDILRGHAKYSTEPITSVEQALERYGIRKVHVGHLERLAEILGILAKKDACNLRAS